MLPLGERFLLEAVVTRPLRQRPASPAYSRVLYNAGRRCPFVMPPTATVSQRVAIHKSVLRHPLPFVFTQRLFAAGITRQGRLPCPHVGRIPLLDHRHAASSVPCPFRLDVLTR